jgi:hypothetical protein
MWCALQVSYCQGMAFVAGVVLMYLPEEPAFCVLGRLMGPGGCDLRTLFLPGLEGLKQLLRTFEWLMQRLMPRLKAHLEVRMQHSRLCLLNENLG